MNRQAQIIITAYCSTSSSSVTSASVVAICPDCPTRTALDNANIVKATSLSLDKFNKESGLVNRFNLGTITLAVSQVSSTRPTVRHPSVNSVFEYDDISAQRRASYNVHMAHAMTCTL